MSNSDPNKDYFLINRKVYWSTYKVLQAGDEFEVGSKSNPFFRFIETTDLCQSVTFDNNPNDIRKFPIADYFDNISSGQFKTNMDIAKLAANSLRHYVKYVRELTWEEIRRNEFPDLPSRQRCLWLIPSKDKIPFWMNKLLGGNSTEFQILRVSAQGKIHSASEALLMSDSQSHTKTIKDAQKYWLGHIDDPETEEVIFEGKITVQEVLPKELFM